MLRLLKFGAGGQIRQNVTDIKGYVQALWILGSEEKTQKLVKFEN